MAKKIALDQLRRISKTPASATPHDPPNDAKRRIVPDLPKLDEEGLTDKKRP